MRHVRIWFFMMRGAVVVTGLIFNTRETVETFRSPGKWSTILHAPERTIVHKMRSHRGYANDSLKRFPERFPPDSKHPAEFPYEP